MSYPTVAFNNFAIAVTPVGHKRKPGWKRPETPGVLRCVVEIIRTRCRIAKVGSTVLKDLQLKSLVSGELHRGVVWNIKPFMRINGNTVSVINSFEVMLKLFRTSCKTTKCSIDMQPEVILRLKFSDRFEIIEVDRIDWACICNHDNRLTMFMQLIFKRLDIDSLSVGQCFNLYHRLTPSTQH